MIIRKLITLLGFDVDESGAAEYEKKFDALGKKAAAWGAGMSVALTAPIAMAFNSILGVAGEFEATQNRIQSATQATAEEMDRLSEKAKQVGADGASSATEVLAGFEELAKAGVSIEDIINGQGQAIMELATATGASATESAGLMSGIMSYYKMSADQADFATDQMVGFANATNKGFDDYKQAMASTGGVAASFGIEFKDLNAMLAVLSPSFAAGSDMGTSFKSMLMSLKPVSKGAAMLMEQYGFSAYTANGEMKTGAELASALQKSFGALNEEDLNSVLGTIFGSDGLRAAIPLIRGGADAVNGMTDAIVKQGDATAVAESAMKGYAGAGEQLSGALDTLMLNIANSGLLEWATDLKLAATSLVEWISALNPRILKFGTALAIVAAVIGPLLAALGAFILLIGAISFPFLAIAAAIGVAIAAIVAFWPEIMAGVKVAGKWISGVGDAIKQGFLDMVAWIKENWAALLLGFPGILLANVAPDLFKPIQDAFQKAFDWIASLWSTIGGILTAPLRGITDTVGGWINSVRDWGNTPMTVHPNAIPSATPAPMRARGGAVRAGQPYTVGEDGAEQFVPTRDGTILPAGITNLLSNLGNVRGMLPGAPSAPAGRGGQTLSIGSVSVTPTINIPEGTGSEQRQSLIDGLGNAIQEALGNAIRGAAYDFPTMEAPV